MYAGTMASKRLALGAWSANRFAAGANFQREPGQTRKAHAQFCDTGWKGCSPSTGESDVCGRSESVVVSHSTRVVRIAVGLLMDYSTFRGSFVRNITQ